MDNKFFSFFDINQFRYFDSILLIFVVLVILVLMLFIIIYFVSIFQKINSYKKTNIKNKLTKQINDFVNSKQDTIDFDIKYQDIIAEIISSKLQEYTNQEEKILKIKSGIIDKIILPKIVKNHTKHDFINNFYLICFLSYSNNPLVYENIIIELTHDKHLINRLNAVIIGCKNPSGKILNAIVTIMSKERSHVRKSIVLSKVNSNKFKEIVFNLIKQSTDIYYKEACYSLLHLNDKDTEFLPYLENDINNYNDQLALSAIGPMAAVLANKYNNNLINHCDSPNWKIRSKTIKELSKNKSIWAIDHIAKKLNDESVWVRGSAIKALISFGADGIELLDKHINNNSSEIKDEINYYLKIS